MLRKVFILVLIFLLSSLAISAQELPEDANECNEGGTMEGKCDGDVNGDGVITPFETRWAWTCGWYMARFNTGEYSRNQVPVFCSSLLPAEVEGDGGDDGGVTDLCYTGPFPEDPPYYSIYRISTGDFVRNSATDEGLPRCEEA